MYTFSKGKEVITILGPTPDGSGGAVREWCINSAAIDTRSKSANRPFTVRALAYIIAGHVAHHVRILRERYLL